MKRYVAFAWNPANELAAASMDTVQRRLGAEPEWMLVHGRPGFAIALEHPHPLEIRPLGDGSGWVIGDLYQKADFRPAPDVLGEIRQDSFPGRRLIEDFWGRYVAIWRTPAGLEILRDPSGALDAVRWRANSVDLTASGLPPTWIGDLAPRTSIDWDIFAGQLVEPILASETVALKGITSVPAGAHFVQSHNGGAYQRIWAPATIVRSSAPTPFEGAAEQLEALVDDCIGAMARNRGLRWLRLFGQHGGLAKVGSDSDYAASLRSGLALSGASPG